MILYNLHVTKLFFLSLLYTIHYTIHYLGTKQGVQLIWSILGPNSCCLRSSGEKLTRTPAAVGHWHREVMRTQLEEM